MIDPNRLRQVYISKGDGLVMWDLCSKCTSLIIRGTTQETSPKVIVTNTGSLKPGYLVVGRGIPVFTTILSIDSSEKLTMSKKAICTAPEHNLTFFSCQLANRCRYAKKGHCAVESRYLYVVCNPIVQLLKNPEVQLTELDWLDFGLKLVPLYHDLIRVKKAEAILDSILVDSVHGVKVHPLLKEKRDIIKAIDSLDITKTLKDRFRELGMKDVISGKGPSVDEIMEQEGDPNFADSLMGKGDDEVIR